MTLTASLVMVRLCWLGTNLSSFGIEVDVAEASDGVADIGTISCSAKSYNIAFRNSKVLTVNKHLVNVTAAMEHV